jgi:hypothetical protein
MAVQTGRRFAFKCRSLGKDAGLCALLLSVASGTGATGETAARDVKLYYFQPNAELFAVREWDASAALAPCPGAKRFVYGTSGTGFIQYWHPIYRAEDTTYLSEGFRRAQDLFLDQLC